MVKSSRRRRRRQHHRKVRKTQRKEEKEKKEKRRKGLLPDRSKLPRKDEMAWMVHASRAPEEGIWDKR